MIVIADTTPLNHLCLTDQVDLLQALYGRVIVPQAVLSELQARAAPSKVKAWIGNRPDWLEVPGPLRTSRRRSPSCVPFTTGLRKEPNRSSPTFASIILRPERLWRWRALECQRLSTGCSPRDATGPLG